jgi:hypothetical protein
MTKKLTPEVRYRWLRSFVYHRIVNRPGYGHSIAWVTFDRLPEKYYLEVLEMGFASAVEIINHL